MNKGTKEAFKEFGRLVLLAAIPAAIDAIGLFHISPEFIGILTIVLRVVDKFLHEAGKETDNEQLAKGITRF